MKLSDQAIEVAARALCLADNKDPDSEPGHFENGVLHGTFLRDAHGTLVAQPGLWVSYKQKAEAALTAALPYIEATFKTGHNPPSTVPLYANLDDRMTGKQQRPMTEQEEHDTKTFYDHVGKQIDEVNNNAVYDFFALANVRLQTLKSAAKCAAAYDQEYETGAGADIAKRILNLDTGS